MNRKYFIKIIMILTLFFTLITTQFMTIYAENIGPFTITGEGDYSYSDGILTIHNGNVTVSTDSETSDRIVIDGNSQVTIKDVSIKATTGPAISVETNAKATLTIEGTNTIQGADGYSGIEPKWSKDEMSTLTINGTGTLNVTGGYQSAALGGSKKNNGVHGNIIIESGTINATAGKNSAGIGTSDNPANGTSSGSYKYITDQWGSITINGGTINAKGEGFGAGIGGGNHSDSGKIIINDGNITATGHTGIGCGYGSSKPGAGDTKGPGYYSADIEINGGTIIATATSGGEGNLGTTDDSGAGIGGGEYSDAKIKITGGTIIATGGNASGSSHHGGAGIGGGYMGHTEVIIEGGDITATGGAAAAGIGSGATPNANPDRGNSSRTGEMTCSQTDITITGGTINATGGYTGGAGIGGGVGADEVSITITGGDITAQGGKSSEDAMQGGAGIGSGYSGDGSGENAKYFSHTDVDVDIEGGNIVAVGGWGASAIGSGAANTMANSITITDNVSSLEAYSDGTKFAIDTRLLDEEGNTTSQTNNRDINGNVIQGTFVHEGQIGDSIQNPEGLKDITITNDDTDESKTLTNMPSSYRSFATVVNESGTYTVYTEDDNIGEGEGRYFSICTKDIYNEDDIVRDKNGNPIGVKFDVTYTALSDNFYLFPVKTVVVNKKVKVEEGKLSDINETFYFALQSKADGTFLTRKDGSLWIESIKVTKGQPESKAYFVDVPDKTYIVWEVDKNGKEIKENTSFTSGVLKKIEKNSEHSDNNVIISEEHWTDKLTFTNTFSKETKTINIKVNKVWDDNDDKDGIRPDSITVKLYSNKKLIQIAQITKEDNWTYTFEDLPEGTYTIKEDSIKDYTTSITGDQKSGYTITNTHTSQVPQKTKTGDNTTILPYVVGIIISLIIIIFLIRKYVR